jgi:hypothetical protein
MHKYPGITNIRMMACFVSMAVGAAAAKPLPASDMFAVPHRGIVSNQQPQTGDWPQGLLAGNGTMGAMVMGYAHDETIYLSHAGLFLPNNNSERYIQMAPRLDEIRKLCLEGNYGEAGKQINAARKEMEYRDRRDPFIGAFALRIRQPESTVGRYQRTVNFMTAEAKVAVEDEDGRFERRTFVSRPDDVVVFRLTGSAPQTAEFSFEALPAAKDQEKQIIAGGVKSSEQGVKDGYLYFRMNFAKTNAFNPNVGFEGVGKVIAKQGTGQIGEAGIKIERASEILVLVKIRPLLKSATTGSNFEILRDELNALPGDHAKLLEPHAKAHGDLMGRVSLSLNAPEAERAKPVEQLNEESKQLDAPLAKIERAFDAGRYNIICSTGFYPPNLQGLWSATWLAPWSGSFTVNGNLPSAVSFLLMGNTPELMKPYFKYYDDRWDGFRDNSTRLFGMRGFHVPAQLTVSPRATDFNANYPHCFWHGGAAWALQYYYDYCLHTGDEKYLAEHVYPLMKEAAAFYEDFLTVTDERGKLVFVPSYSPENTPGGKGNSSTAINATIDVSAAKQLLRNAIAVAKKLNRDAALQEKWAAIISKLPEYEVDQDGYFREWLWKDLPENLGHRHASQFYALYDEMPPEIVDNPKLVTAIEKTIRKKLDIRERERMGMAFGAVQLGLAAAHIRNGEQAEKSINMLAKHFWSNSMSSYHDWGKLFNTDISGGFPYLCASSLVYADPGHIVLLPARPPQWQTGSLKGVRLRGGIVVEELSWNTDTVTAVLVADADQTVTVVGPDGKSGKHRLQAGVPLKLLQSNL